MSWEAKINEIAKDNLSGSEIITRKAANLILNVLKNLSDPIAEDELLSLGKRLIEAKPDMAPLKNMVNNLFLAYEQREDLINWIKRFIKEESQKIKMVTEKGVNLIKSGMTVMTHSASSTLSSTFIIAFQKGIKFKLFITESRPKQEGITMAKKMASAGIPVTLITDCSIFALMEKCNIFLVGADSITLDGVINKAGTKGYALFANYYKIPFYCLTTTSKILPEALSQPFSIREEDPTEILSPLPKGFHVLNFYFDLTPLNWFSGIVTENGILSKDDLRMYISKQKISDLWEKR